MKERHCDRLIQGALLTPGNEYDAVVLGGGPNGLAATIVMAQAGKSVAVFEANDTIGGGVRRGLGCHRACTRLAHCSRRCAAPG